MAILLTGTIAPAVDFVAVGDISQRRQQYIAALDFYRKLAPTYFVENSSYDLSADTGFTEFHNVRLRKFSMMPAAGRGKGYQEFAMVDAWYERETDPPRRFLKITGRYIVRNVADLLLECQAAAPATLLIDRLAKNRTVLTSVFSVSWETYGQKLKGLYREMDDSIGLWAERVYFQALAQDRNVRSFAHEPDLRGISGSTGQRLNSSRWKWLAKQSLRRLNRLANPGTLHFRG